MYVFISVFSVQIQDTALTFSKFLNVYPNVYD